jgi:uncharacterized surface anchored protein
MNFKLSLAALVFFVFTYSVISQTSTGSINGSVIDKSTNTPVESADVVLLSANDSALIKGISTGADGSFSFTGITYGSYMVRVSLVGYNTVSVKGIVLTSDKPSVMLDPVKLT